MPFRCPCGTEFDPWDGVCPRCGGKTDIDAVRAPVRMACERGHVAFRATATPEACPVCNALLTETPLAAEPPLPTEVAQPQDAAKAAERRIEVLRADVTLRMAAYAIAVRALVVLAVVWPRLFDQVVPLGSSALPSRLVTGRARDLPVCGFGLMLALYLLLEARQIILRRSPFFWILVATFGLLALEGVLSMLLPGFSMSGRGMIPFPWSISGMDRGLVEELGWVFFVARLLVFTGDLLVVYVLRSPSYGVVFYYGMERSRLATPRELRSASMEMIPWGPQMPFVCALLGNAVLLMMVLW